jgi:hypothetical protein
VALARFPLRCKKASAFVDESGFHTSMTRLYARAPKGKRVSTASFRVSAARTLPSSPRSPSKELWVPP